MAVGVRDTLFVKQGDVNLRKTVPNVDEIMGYGFHGARQVACAILCFNRMFWFVQISWEVGLVLDGPSEEF